MGKLRILSRSGDTTVEWDRREVKDTGAEEAVRQAERIFKEERAKGATAFKVLPGEPAKKVDEFDPEAEQIVMVPRVAGG